MQCASPLQLAYTTSTSSHDNTHPDTPGCHGTRSRSWPCTTRTPCSTTTSQPVFYPSSRLFSSTYTIVFDTAYTPTPPTATGGP